MNIIDIAAKAVRMYAESHPRPSSVTQEQAAEMLSVSSRTVRNMIRHGTIKLNSCGRIPTCEIDRVLAAKESAAA